jgi:hypothetical protein
VTTSFDSIFGSGRGNNKGVPWEDIRELVLLVDAEGQRLWIQAYKRNKVTRTQHLQLLYDAVKKGVSDLDELVETAVEAEDVESCLALLPICYPLEDWCTERFDRQDSRQVSTVWSTLYAALASQQYAGPLTRMLENHAMTDVDMEGLTRVYLKFSAKDQMHRNFFEQQKAKLHSHFKTARSKGENEALRQRFIDVLSKRRRSPTNAAAYKQLCEVLHEDTWADYQALESKVLEEVGLTPRHATQSQNWIFAQDVQEYQEHALVGKSAVLLVQTALNAVDELEERPSARLHAHPLLRQWLNTTFATSEARKHDILRQILFDSLQYGQTMSSISFDKEKFWDALQNATQEYATRPVSATR